jgi:hypothetical protein
MKINSIAGSLLGRELLAFKGVLHPRQFDVLTANFMRPPVVGVAIDTVRVWSPLTRKF